MEGNLHGSWESTGKIKTSEGRTLVWFLNYID